MEITGCQLWCSNTQQLKWFEAFHGLIITEFWASTLLVCVSKLQNHNGRDTHFSRARHIMVFRGGGVVIWPLKSFWSPLPPLGRGNFIAVTQLSIATELQCCDPRNHTGWTFHSGRRFQVITPAWSGHNPKIGENHKWKFSFFFSVENNSSFGKKLVTL